jgi:hypothetical protein
MKQEIPILFSLPARLYAPKLSFVYVPTARNHPQTENDTEANE